MTVGIYRIYNKITGRSKERIIPRERGILQRDPRAIHHRMVYFFDG